MRWFLCLSLAGCAANHTAASLPDLSAPSSPDLSGGTVDLLASPPSPTDLGTTHDLEVMVQQHSILPSMTDPAISNPNEAHLAFYSGAGNGLLYIFLPGTGGIPANYDEFLGFAASTGYHVIGLEYPNNNGTISTLCNTDLSCYPKVRGETYSGEDLSPLIDIDTDNCIHNRLVKLLAYLIATYPAEGWDTFYEAGEPAWNKIVVSGHSQGGGHAAWIASLESVVRVVTFSSPDDASPATTPPTPAAWLSTHVTQSARYYGIDHMDDGYFPKVVVAFKALGMDSLGPLTDVDKAAPPYGNTHELTSTRPLTTPHNQVVGNSVPLVNGVPVYEDAWRYLIGPR